MRKNLVFFLLFLFVSTTALAGVHRVGTYNIRTTGMSADTLERAWGKRKASVVKMIRDSMNFDVVAMQEVSNQQHTYINEQLGDVYSYYDGPSTGNEILYRKSKYTCMDKGYYYLAPDPTQPGAAWDAQQTRYGCWVKLKDKVSGEIFYFCATHLDLYPKSIREGARVNVEQMLKIAGSNACIITGDMNSEPGDRDPHANFRECFGNARDMSLTEPQGSYFTFASGMDPDKASKLLDYLYVRNVAVESYFVNNSTLGRTLMPSDHMPVVCEITVLPKLRATTHVVNNVDELRQAGREVQAGDIIYLNEGLYDLGDSALNLVSSCVMQGDEKAVLTGSGQLFNNAEFISLELRDLHIENFVSDEGLYGAIIDGRGNYLTLSNCTISNCQTNGVGLVYASDCKLTVDHCVFRDNKADRGAGGLAVTSNQSAYSFSFALTQSQFINNNAYYAPAVYICGKNTAYLSSNTFVGNQALDRGCVLIDAAENTTDVRLVNNTFVNNRICTSASRLDASVGGSAIWQTMGAKGCMTLMNNTIVGNYTASWKTSGGSSDKFRSGAVHSASGKLKLYNNIIAGNYSSCPGHGDLSMADTSMVAGSSYNLFTAQDNTNYSLRSSDISADKYARGLRYLKTLYGGTIEDSIYHAPELTYGEDRVVALVPLETTFAGKNIAVVTASARSASTVGSDILNTGSKSGTLTQDQIGTTRLSSSVPGSMEVGQTPTFLENRFTDSPTPRFTKIIKDNQLIIINNNVRYNAQGLRL